MGALECLHRHQLGADQPHAVHVKPAARSTWEGSYRLTNSRVPVMTPGAPTVRPSAETGANAAAGKRTVAPAGDDPSITAEQHQRDPIGWH